MYCYLNALFHGACISLYHEHMPHEAWRAAKKAGERVLLRAEAQRKRRGLQRKVLYTNPLAVSYTHLTLPTKA